MIGSVGLIMSMVFFGLSTTFWTLVIRYVREITLVPSILLVLMINLVAVLLAF